MISNGGFVEIRRHGLGGRCCPDKDRRLRSPTGWGHYTSVCSAISKASSTSMPRYLDGALQLAVPQQQLDDSQILSAAVDQCRLGPPHRVRTVRSWIKPDGLHPSTNDSCVLASGQVRGLAQAAGEEMIVWPALGVANPTRQ